MALGVLLLQPRCEEGTNRKIPSDCECVRTSKRDETSPAPQSALHLSTGPQWVYPTVKDYIYTTREYRRR
ncbi:hypothetical protein NQZ68_012244 [Dissostichus eleginoides]|nr:hypothetical protein NQZ68_012244 [Dissostichus eleginoides]